MSNWIIPILQRLPPGWTITFSRAALDVVEIEVVGWFPHFPRTSGERRFCQSYKERTQIQAMNLEMTELDLIKSESAKAVGRVMEYVHERRVEAESKAEGGGS